MYVCVWVCVCSLMGGQRMDFFFSIFEAAASDCLEGLLLTWRSYKEYEPAKPKVGCSKGQGHWSVKKMIRYIQVRTWGRRDQRQVESTTAEEDKEQSQDSIESKMPVKTMTRRVNIFASCECQKKCQTSSYYVLMSSNPCFVFSSLLPLGFFFFFFLLFFVQLVESTLDRVWEIITGSSLDGRLNG